MERKAASVLPLPVGARIKVFSPARVCGRAEFWIAVKPSKRDRNHSCTAGWSRVSILLMRRRQVQRRFVESAHPVEVVGLGAGLVAPPTDDSREAQCEPALVAGAFLDAVE